MRAVAKVLASVLWRVPRFCGMAVSAWFSLRGARRRATNAFHQALLANGVPEALARDLQAEYPEVPVGEIVRPCQWR